MNKAATSKLLQNKIGVMPTDTIYGIATSALSKKTVERAYKVLKRNKKKPFIILIGSMRDLALFKIKLDNKTQRLIRKLWPGKISIVLPVISSKFHYLHRGTKTLAFRMPEKRSLLKLLKKTGPLISTSANPQGKRPAETIAEAKKYFKGSVDFYVSGGKIKSLPSTLVEIKNGKIVVLRKGIVRIPNL
jgi:L-threonylcarbamoyladenylate synthase